MATATRPTEPLDAARLYGRGRLSAARRDIAQGLASLGGAFTAEDLHTAVSALRPGIGVATVYRAVTAMAEAGSLAPVGARDGSTLYTRCAGGKHHHHLVCTGCGTVVSVACPVDGPLVRSAREAGYTVTAHEVTLYGLCPTCSKERG